MGKSESLEKSWYSVGNIEDVSSPALLLYPDRIEQNILKMIRMAGNTDRLRPHVKTHKMREIIGLQMKQGITRFKCATISEAEMVAVCGGRDILLAMQPVGPNLERFFKLKQEFLSTAISCIADSEEIISMLSDAAAGKGLETHVWLDINNGMNRTGIKPGEEAIRLYRMIADSPGLKAAGLHVYDGHIHEKNFCLRQKECNDSFEPVTEMIRKLEKSGQGQIKIVAGGTPTFSIHSLRKDVELSPGTTLLWDFGYSSSFTDMEYLHAAVLLTRIVSKPGDDILCLDLGHKAVASEMAQPRVKILNLDNYTIINHNEEHMVIRTPDAGRFRTGDHFYCIPWHICPTVDRYDSVSIVNDNKVTGEWHVEARKRKITI